MTRTYRKTAALLALAILVPLLATNSVGAATPPAAGERVPIGEEFTLAEGGGETAYGWPDISSDPITGQSLIVYDYALDTNLDGIDEEKVKARIVGNNGVIGDEFTINTTLPSTGFLDFEPPTAAWNSTLEEWLVTWTDNAIVYGQRVDTDGTLIGVNFIIAASLDGTASDADNFFTDIEHVRAEWSPTLGIYLVSWKASGSAGAVAFTQTILANVIDEAGNWVLDGPAVDVSEETANDGVTVAYSPTSDVWLVGWERQDVDELPGARILSASISGALFDIDFDTAPLAISTTGVGAGGAPEATWDSTRDRFIVIWRATQPADVTAQHYFNFVEPDGSFTEGDEKQIGGDTGEDARRARVAYSPVDDEYSVVAHRQAVDAADVWELLNWSISGDGTTADEAVVITSVGDRRARPIVAYGGGCFRYVWWDVGQFWDDGDFSGLPDSVFAWFGCGGCYVFDPGSDTFTDVTVGRFYDEPIGWLILKELTTGTTPTTFEPDRGVTRGEFATFLWRFDGKAVAPLGSVTFVDVTVGRFYDRPIGWLFQEMITTGTGPDTFAPDRTLTRGELATFLWRYAGQPAAPLGSATFTDVDAGRFYDEAIGWLFQEEITTGTTPTTFEPERTLTRGEMATFLYRFAGAARCVA